MGWGCWGASQLVAEGDQLVEQLGVGGLAGAGVVFEADADVAAAFEGEAGEALLNDIAAEQRDGPGESRAFEH